MSEKEIQCIAENANFIVNGYAFTKRDNGLIEIFNLDKPNNAMVINHDNEMIETNMGQIEQTIVLELAHKNIQFLEV
jgi:predicted nuclease of predicted toxin-antitoxin system